MRLSRPIVFAALAVVGSASSSSASSSTALCPIVGPTPPAQCDGRDGMWVPVSVAGSGTFCALGPEVCVAKQFAACPGPSEKLPFGSKCTQVSSDVYGCTPKTSCDDGVFSTSPNVPPPVTSADCEGGCTIDPTIPQQCDGLRGWSSVSVVGSGTFCARGPICSGDAQDACPAPQRGLPFGSSCIRIPSGVFGCVKNSKCEKGCGNAVSDPGSVNHDLCGTAGGPTVDPAPMTSTPAPSPTTTTPAPASTAPPTVPPVASRPATTTVSPTTQIPTAPATSAPTPSTSSTSAPSSNQSSNTPVPNLIDTFTTGGFEIAEAPSSLSPENGDIPMIGAGRLRERRLVTGDAQPSTPKATQTAFLLALALAVGQMFGF